MDLLDLARETGLNPKKVASTKGGEYHSACPSCGGKDRFIIHPSVRAKNCDGRFLCRQCEIKGDAIQFCMDFLGKDFLSALEYLGLPAPDRPPRDAISDWRKKPSPKVLELPNAEWLARAEELVQIGEHYLCKAPEKLGWLAGRGLPAEVVKKFRLGYLPQQVPDDRKAWGLLPIMDEKGEEKALWLPKGLVIPSIDGGKVVRLRIRTEQWDVRYYAISGSMAGYHVVGSFKAPVLAVVESELDAIALHAAVPDLLCAVAAGSNTTNPDNVTDYYAKKARHLFICHDNDDAGLAMLRKWKREYPHAVPMPTPVGKDVGEAIQHGFDVADWMLRSVEQPEGVNDTSRKRLEHRERS
jgi:DNA primase